MAFWKRARAPARTTPIFDRNARRSFWPVLVKALAIPAIPLVLLALCGSPALRMWYRWDGRTPPAYYECLYLSLSGWHRVTPPFGVNQCPLVTLFPFNIEDIIGGAS